MQKHCNDTTDSPLAAMELPFAFNSESDRDPFERDRVSRIAPTRGVLRSTLSGGAPGAAAALPSVPPRYANAPGGAHGETAGGTDPPPSAVSAPPRYDNIQNDQFYPPAGASGHGHGSYVSPDGSMMTYDLGSSGAVATAVGGVGAGTANPAPEDSMDDFADTFVTVCESDVRHDVEDEEGSDADDDDDYYYDGVVDYHHRVTNGRRRGGDILALLLSGGTSSSKSDEVVEKCNQANGAAREASDSTRRGDMKAACVEHTRAARAFRDAAVVVNKTDRE